MALSKKGSRSITVGQEQYRWVVSPAAKGMMVLTVQHTEGNGQMIRVYAKADVHGHAQGDAQQVRIIKPAEVAAIIPEAILLGWTPTQPGAPLHFERIGSTLTKKGT